MKGPFSSTSDKCVVQPCVNVLWKGTGLSLAAYFGTAESGCQ